MTMWKLLIVSTGLVNTVSLGLGLKAACRHTQESFLCGFLIFVVFLVLPGLTWRKGSRNLLYYSAVTIASPFLNFYCDLQPTTSKASP